MFQSTFHYQRRSASAKLNLVALMDIFTILVFFLLLNTGEAEQLENAKFVNLPSSHAGTSPHGDLVLMIDQDGIWFGDQMLARVDDVMQNLESEIEPLATALADYRDRKGELNSYEQENGLSLTLMGDHAVSFGLLKSVMQTCRLENFRDIALAVNQVVAPAAANQEPSENGTSPEMAARSFPR